MLGDIFAGTITDWDDPRLVGANYLIKGWLDRAAFSVVYGASGSGKTFLALDLALHVAGGTAWHGTKVRAAGSVVYLAAEGGGAFDNRCMAWASEEPFAWPKTAPNFHALTLPIDLFGSNDAEELVKATADLKPILIVIDTLARAMGKGDENTARDMGIITMNVGQIIAETGAHLMVVHHSGKEASKGARGSSSLRGAVDTEISVVKEGGIITATSDKRAIRGQRCTRFGWRFEFAPVYHAVTGIHRASGALSRWLVRLALFIVVALAGTGVAIYARLDDWRMGRR